MSNKRKHKTLDLKDKIEILKKLDSGENMCKLAKEYGVGRSTIHDLKKKKQKIVDHVKTMESGPGKRKTLKVGYCPQMEKALYIWFMQQRSNHTPISGEILKAKAIEFYKKITQKDDFHASDGWLDKFKKRFGIRLLTISGEKLSSDESAVQPFMQHFKNKVEELVLLPDQINNADESGLFRRLLPNKTFVSSKEASAPARKETETHFKKCWNILKACEKNLNIASTSTGSQEMRTDAETETAHAVKEEPTECYEDPLEQAPEETSVDAPASGAGLPAPSPAAGQSRRIVYQEETPLSPSSRASMSDDEEATSPNSVPERYVTKLSQDELAFLEEKYKRAQIREEELHQLKMEEQKWLVKAAEELYKKNTLEKEAAELKLKRLQIT